MLRHEAALASSMLTRASPGGQPTHRQSLCLGTLAISAVVSPIGMAYHTSMKPQIVLDTNVLVAVLRSRRGTAFHLVSLLPAALFEINLSVSLVFEYEEVLPQHRRVMGLTLTDIMDFLDFLCAIANLHEIFFLWRPALT